MAVRIKIEQCSYRHYGVIIRQNIEFCTMNTISPVYARLVLRDLEQHDIDPSPLFIGTGLSRQTLLEGGDISLDDFLHILRTGQALAPDNRLGLMLGRNAHTSVLGPLGAAMNIAPSVREGLRLLESFTRVHISYIDFDISTSPTGVTLGIIYREDTGTLEYFHTETTVMLLQQYIETTVGETLVDAHYEFAYPTPDNLEDYQAALHGELSFDAARNQVHLPRYWLDRPSPYFHAEMWQQAQLDLSRLLAEQSKSIDGTFTRHISAQLRSGEPPLPDLEAVAASLHVSQRTLNRRLLQEGSSYRQLKSAALAHWGKLYLEHTDDSVESIAAALGYQDAANFRRAFRRNVGTTPNTYRMDRRGDR
ncbi:hypothetical protein BST95_09880 [Halioglobus japonicus]|nr:hypothetical protein BST95_09880 [Halioglobus japonicus]